MRSQTALAESGPLATAGASPRDEAMVELLRRWLGLSELERRAFAALIGEVTEASTLVETSTLDLSDRFQSLATIAQAQIGRVETIMSVAKSIEVDGRAVPLQEAMQSVEDVLRKIIETIVTVSKHAMRMVYALDDVARDVDGAESCVGRIKSINTQTRYLALNAAIEANRSGADGGAFRVIARELKELSHETERTSREVQERISSITAGVRGGHRVLQEIATLDMSEHIMAKERLDALIAAVIEHNGRFTEVLSATAASSADMAGTVGQLITGMQFQDRTKQHLEHVTAVLAVLGDAIASTQDATRETCPGRFEADSLDRVWLERIVEGQTLGAVKQRLLARLLNGDEGSAPDDAASDAGGDIELF